MKVPSTFGSKVFLIMNRNILELNSGMKGQQQHQMRVFQIKLQWKYENMGYVLILDTFRLAGIRISAFTSVHFLKPIAFPNTINPTV
jgi:hypothetical protein